MDTPPLFPDCRGYWIAREQDPTREGLIEKTRANGRRLYVNFNQGDGNIFLTDVPYDEPNLIWLREITPEEDSAIKIQAMIRGR
jgi:hypothetical protein